MMESWKSLTGFMYGDVKTGQGFWYSHPLWELDGLSEDQLYWTPLPVSLCILWHVGHIAHWLFITACHTSLHIGRIQLLRAMIQNQLERAY